MRIEEIIEKIKDEVNKINNNEGLSLLRMIREFNKVYNNILPDLEAVKKEQDELIKENKQLKKALRQARAYNYDDLTNRGSKERFWHNKGR